MRLVNFEKPRPSIRTEKYGLSELIFKENLFSFSLKESPSFSIKSGRTITFIIKTH